MSDGLTGEQPTHRAEILVVDDQPAIAELVAETLCDEGYLVRAAHDGVSALAAIRQRRPDLLILDVAMPLLSGDQVLRRLQSEGPSDLPVILMTADKAPERFVGLGARTILRKPFDLAAMVRAVERCVGERWPARPLGLGQPPAPLTS